MFLSRLLHISSTGLLVANSWDLVSSVLRIPLCDQRALFRAAHPLRVWNRWPFFSKRLPSWQETSNVHGVGPAIKNIAHNKDWDEYGCCLAEKLREIEPRRIPRTRSGAPSAYHFIRLQLQKVQGRAEISFQQKKVQAWESWDCCRWPQPVIKALASWRKTRLPGRNNRNSGETLLWLPVTPVPPSLLQPINVLPTIEHAVQE